MVATGNIASRPMPLIIKVTAGFTFPPDLKCLGMHLQVSGGFYFGPGGRTSKYS